MNNIAARRNELLEKANNMIDIIQQSMCMVENVEAAKKKFLASESELSLELPTGDPSFKDVFELAEIFDERGIEKIKAYILTELDVLEDNALKILDIAGFHENSMKTAGTEPEPCQMTDRSTDQKAADTDHKDKEWDELETDHAAEDDSDMKIVIPESIEKGHHSRLPLEKEKVEQIKKLSQEGMKPAEIARQANVSYKTAAKYKETIPNGAAAKGSGRSASSRC